MPPFHDGFEAQPKYTSEVDGRTFEIVRDAKGGATLRECPAPAKAAQVDAAVPSPSASRTAPRAWAVDPSRPLLGRRHNYGEVDDDAPHRAMSPSFEAATPRRGETAAPFSPARGPAPLAWPSPRVEPAADARRRATARDDEADEAAARAPPGAASPTATHMLSITRGCPIAAGRRLAYRDDEEFM